MCIESAIGTAVFDGRVKRQSPPPVGRRPDDVLAIDLKLAIGLETTVAQRIDVQPQRPNIPGRTLAER